MSIYKRYSIIKKLYNESLVIFNEKNNVTSCYYDWWLLQGFKHKKNLLRQLDKKQINYVMVENINVLEEKKFSNNQYNRIYYFEIFNNIFQFIKKHT